MSQLVYSVPAQAQQRAHIDNPTYRAIAGLAPTVW
jgi:hypothetical protein